MSISDTNNARKFASIAETAAAQAKLSADKLNNAPEYAAQAAASAAAAALSAQVAVSAESIVNDLAISASESATSAAASAAEAEGAVGAAIGQCVRAPTGELIDPLPASVSRQNTFLVFDSSGEVSVLPQDEVAILDSEGKVPVSMIPAIALSEIFVVSSQSAMLALTAQEGDIAKRTDLGYSLVLSAEPASTLSNWIQLNDDVLAQLGLQSGATEVGASDHLGNATTVQGALDQKQPKATLIAATGATLVGDPLDTTVANALNKRLYLVDTVSQLLAKNFTGVDDGLHVLTYANRYGVKGLSEWIISSSADSTTYSLALPAGRYANLVCYPDMNYASFDFGGTDTQNVAAVDEGNRVARAQAIVRSLSFPSGSYSIGSFTLDIDKRGFIWDGAGMDVSVLNSTSSGISMHHIGYDIRDRSRDRFHQDQIVRGFTIDGGVGTRGAAAADRVVLGANYGHWAFKSGNHRSSCLDFCCIVGEFTGKTAGTVNGATRTLNGARIRGNSVKMFGGFYLQGSGQIGSAAVNINAPKTTLSADVAAGASTIPVTNASEFLQFDIIEIQGNSGLDAKRITGISGNTLTLDSPLIYAHESAKAVYVDTWGNSLTCGTIESGEMQLGNCKGLSVTGMYVEKSKLYVYNQPESMSVTGNYFGQTTHLIDNPSNLSSFNIEDNYTDTQMEVNIADRNGSINGIIDLYEFPNMKINNLTRSQNSIIVNGVAAFKSINVEKFYDSSTNGSAFTSFKFTGFSASSAVATSAEILRFAQNTATTGYDGHTYDISAVIRRASGLSGLLKRAGQTSIIGSTISDTSAANSRTLNNYAFADPANGMDIIVGSNTSRMGIVLKGEPVGGQAIKAMLSGEITSVI